MSSTELERRRHFSRPPPSQCREARGALPITLPQFLWFVAGCCALHVLLRRLVTETAGIDDVDQVLRAQLWNWGYGPQPPLYTWLTKIFLSLFGYSVFSLLLLKEFLIFSIYALVYAATRQLTQNHVCALMAAALLQVNPSIAWESHRELTHTVLASALSTAAVCLFLRLDPRRWTGYALFGICSGLGMLAKYNFGLVWVALLLAACSVRQLRPVIFNRKFLFALFLGGLICAPHFLWVSQHRDLAMSSLHKLKLSSASDWTLFGRGLNNWFVDILAQLGPGAAVLFVLFGKTIFKPAVAAPREQLLWRTAGWLLIIVTVSIILFRIGRVMDRYIQPLFVWIPIAVAAALREHWSRPRVKAVLALSAVIAVGVLLVAPGRVLLTEGLHKHEVLNTPFEKLAADLRPMVNQADCLIAENHTLAGNFRLWFPAKLVVDAEVGPLFQPGARKTVLIWNASKEAAPPWDLVQFARGFTGSKNLTKPNRFEELLKYHHKRAICLGASLIE